MSGRSVLSFLGVVLVPGFFVAAARGGEPDPWAGEPRHVLERMEELAEAEARGRLGPGEQMELKKYWSTHLRRCPMNALESAHCSIAELHLQRGNPKAAIQALNKILAATEDPQIRNVTHLNLAEVYHRRLNDSAKAIKHYHQVGGPLRHRARYRMLAVLAEKGKPDEAAQLVAKFVGDAKEKGERLALLHRLAVLYKQSYMPDQALATYQRITKEFTPDDIKQMRQAMVRQVNTAVQQITALRERDQWEAAERLERQLHGQAHELRLANRWDELRAFHRALEKGHARLRAHQDELERREEEREREEERREEERERRPEGEL